MSLISINDLTSFFTKCPHALAFIDQTVELCEIDVNANAKTIKHVTDQTIEIYWLALKQDPSHIVHIRDANLCHQTQRTSSTFHPY